MQRPPEELVDLVLKQAGGGDDRHDGTDLVKGRACSDDIEREHDALGPLTWRIVREVQWLEPTHKVGRWDQSSAEDDKLARRVLPNHCQVRQCHTKDHQDDYCADLQYSSSVESESPESQYSPLEPKPAALAGWQRTWSTDRVFHTTPEGPRDDHDGTSKLSAGRRSTRLDRGEVGLSPRHHPLRRKRTWTFVPGALRTLQPV